MEKIASFQVDHTTLRPGMYLSRRDGNVVTFDLRFKVPNTGDLLTNAEMHSMEHIIATLLRNSPQKDAVIYFGPMGCQTGFYVLLDGAQLSMAHCIALIQSVFEAGANYAGEMPGKSAVECGNYINLDVDLAKAQCRYYADVIKGWTVEQLAY
ncbi:S-ribosylhomocysteine lyase [Pseudoflavonifractor sp. An187]|uniref:S-ribosylhomocysteine lyase n=1 Tax=Pseudoflavonifractor sp. An187 TaxID=1965578 RepID=UPI000B367ABC|nr:S-ribosylhomocysteine lyase [Pseudoflavonifractor sp. An187]OUP44535.1 S-ribosylhomocysteine lyase [Pseudoflavonifractor sp. An187]